MNNGNLARLNAVGKNICGSNDEFKQIDRREGASRGLQASMSLARRLGGLYGFERDFSFATIGRVRAALAPAASLRANHVRGASPFEESKLWS